MAVIKDMSLNDNYNKKTKNSKRTSKGRQKISITKIERKASLQVTFSKRRNGLFNKAGELCVLCGAEIAILVFSPHGRPHSFVHPDLDTVLTRYLNIENNSPSSSLDEDNQKGLTLANNNSNDPRVQELNMECEEALRILEEEKGSAKGKAKKESDGFWWDLANIDELGREELEGYVKAMEELQRNVKGKMRKMIIDSVAAAAAGGGGGGRGMENMSGDHQLSRVDAANYSSNGFAFE